MVAAHPQALAQCQDWISEHLPQAERRAVSSNAEGARLAKENPSCGAKQRARSGRKACTSSRTRCKTKRITKPVCRDLPAATLDAPEPTGNDRTSLIVSVSNKPGAMHDLLVPLKNTAFP